MTRLVLDTNVLVSAYTFGGVPGELLRATIRGEFEIVTSPALLAELARVLADKFDFEPSKVEGVVRQVGRIAVVVRPLRRLSVVSDDPDNRVLECAVAGDADAIVTGDHHLLSLGAYDSIPVIRAREAFGGLPPHP